MLYPKKSIAGIIPAIHGGQNYQEIINAGLKPAGLLDFSTNVNPFGPPPGLKKVLFNAMFNTYPDSESTLLREALANKLNISMSNLIMGNGSTEIIRLIALTYLEPGNIVFIPQPSYGDYEISCQIAGARIIKESIFDDVNLNFNTDYMLTVIRKLRPEAIFICNPNNPTGKYFPKSTIQQIVDENNDKLIILDEAYIAFTADSWNSIDLLPKNNLIIIRSMTKDFALAGLRLGYAISSQNIISAINRVKPPWNVSTVAQTAGLYMLESKSYLDDCMIKIISAKKYLNDKLINLGFSIVPSQTHFFLFKVSNATVFRHELLKKGILVRDCTSFGLPEYIRLSPRKLTECRILIEAIKELTNYAC